MTDTTTVSTRVSFDDDTLAGIASFEDALKVLAESGITPESIEDYGNGFKVVDKDTLVKVPFMILAWRFNTGSFTEDFVSCEAVTKHGDKVVFNDGSTGVRAQLQRVTTERESKGHPHPQNGLYCPNGLTVSRYFTNEETGDISQTNNGKGWVPSSTFYLAE